MIQLNLMFCFSSSSYWIILLYVGHLLSYFFSGWVEWHLSVTSHTTCLYCSRCLLTRTLAEKDYRRLFIYSCPKWSLTYKTGAILSCSNFSHLSPETTSTHGLFPFFCHWHTSFWQAKLCFPLILPKEIGWKAFAYLWSPRPGVWTHLHHYWAASVKTRPQIGW